MSDACSSKYVFYEEIMKQCITFCHGTYIYNFEEIMKHSNLQQCITFCHGTYISMWDYLLFIGCCITCYFL